MNSNDTASRDEKYISIPFSIWESKYKPMEQDLNIAIDKLRKEKENKRIEIFLKFYTSWRGDYGLYNVGVIDFIPNIPPSIEFEGRDIKRAISDFLSENVHNGQTLATKDYLDKVEKFVELYYENNVKLSKEIEEKIKKIPKLVRWIFKIKKPDF